MQIVRFRIADRAGYGVLEGAQVVEYTGTPFTAFRRGRRRYPLRQVMLLAPALPSKVVGVALNYRDQAAAAGITALEEPPLFLKPASTVVAPDDPIVYPARSRRVEFGGTLAAVIRRRCRHVSAARAREHVLGYTCVNDVTAADLADRDGLWGRAKSFDTFCPIGPAIVTDVDPNALAVETYVNGEPRQSASTKELLFPVEEVVARVSDVMTLLPGDVVLTGTPAGAGPLRPGDRVEVRIQGIGTLANPVVRL
jgi:2-keto-4-pentenoate hydratase/2-oxohepta-3-ene-1,7-dioic acid hydratase in catechol pathway